MAVIQLLLKLVMKVITKGYGVRATTIEGQNAFAPSLCYCTLRTLHVWESQNTRNQYER